MTISIPSSFLAYTNNYLLFFWVVFSYCSFSWPFTWSSVSTNNSFYFLLSSSSFIFNFYLQWIRFFFLGLPLGLPTYGFLGFFRFFNNLISGFSLWYFSYSNFYFLLVSRNGLNFAEEILLNKTSVSSFFGRPFPLRILGIFTGFNNSLNFKKFG